MTAAGDLREEISLQKSEQVTDPYGNPIGSDWVDQFTAPARIRYLKGGETVIASRLQGTQTLVITLRWQPAVADITTAWRAVNGRDGTIYNIRAVTPDERRAWIDILAESGVAT